MMKYERLALAILGGAIIGFSHGEILTISLGLALSITAITYKRDRK